MATKLKSGPHVLVQESLISQLYSDADAARNALDTLLQRFIALEEACKGASVTSVRFPDARDRAAMKRAKEVLEGKV